MSMEMTNPLTVLRFPSQESWQSMDHHICIKLIIRFYDKKKERK